MYLVRTFLLGIQYDTSNDIWSGIIIGAVGGGAAGLIIWAFGLFTKWCTLKMDQRKVYKWLNNLPRDANNNHLSYDLKAIASLNNLTDDRARYVCSTDKRILESLGEVRDRWGIRN